MKFNPKTNFFYQIKHFSLSLKNTTPKKKHTQKLPFYIKQNLFSKYLLIIKSNSKTKHPNKKNTTYIKKLIN